MRFRSERGRVRHDWDSALVLTICDYYASESCYPRVVGTIGGR